MCGNITGNKLCRESLQKATREEFVGQAACSVGKKVKAMPYGNGVAHVHNRDWTPY